MSLRDYFPFNFPLELLPPGVTEDNILTCEFENQVLTKVTACAQVKAQYKGVREVPTGSQPNRGERPIQSGGRLWFQAHPYDVTRIWEYAPDGTYRETTDADTLRLLSSSATKGDT